MDSTRAIPVLQLGLNRRAPRPALPNLRPDLPRAPPALKKNIYFFIFFFYIWWLINLLLKYIVINLFLIVVIKFELFNDNGNNLFLQLLITHKLTCMRKHSRNARALESALLTKYCASKVPFWQKIPLPFSNPSCSTAIPHAPTQNPCPPPPNFLFSFFYFWKIVRSSNKWPHPMLYPPLNSKTCMKKSGFPQWFVQCCGWFLWNQ